MLCIKLVNYCDKYKYTEMHGQQNVKIYTICLHITVMFCVHVSLLE